MESSNARAGKVKLIAWIVIIAAVVVLYFAIGSRSRAMNNTSDLTPSTTSRSNTPSSNPTPATANPGTSSYKDGTYSASASYRTPDSIETIDVSLTVAGGVVTGSSVHQIPTTRDARVYQSYFAENYKPYVVGKKLSDISLSRISGSSLTPQGFNDALDQIKSQAAG